jgi:enoyl-CoA hydratase
MLLVERQNIGLCAVLTLNRPAVLNALDDALLDALDVELDTAEVDSCRAVVIVGRGRAFCAGSDLGGAHGDPEARVRRMHRLVERLQTFPKITIAALNGLALGGGLEIALACTFRVAMAKAKLGLPEVKLGLIPLYGGTHVHSK